MSAIAQFPRIAFTVCASFAVMVAACPARASDATAWDGNERAAIRLIAGAPRIEQGATILRAGIELRLAPGWKTYWRYPGDSGIPPRFDFSASQNVKSVTVLWPAPQRMTDEGGTSIGYKHDIVFPLRVVAQDGGKPVKLAVSMDYGVCEKFCAPADGKAELPLGGKANVSSEYEAKLAQSEALVPKPAVVGDSAALAIRSVKRESASRVIVDVAAPAGARVDLFAEGPTSDWALPVPSPVDGAPAGTQRFAFELEGLPPNTKPDGAELKFTAVAGDQAIEVPYRLD